MTTQRDIARDPRKALRDLEERLGAKPGELLAEMHALGDGTDDWTQHLPFHAAENFYADPEIRSLYGTHVNRCSLCRSLLEILHPLPAESAAFARAATGANAKRALTRRVTQVVTALAFASLTGGAWLVFARNQIPQPSQCVAEGGTASAAGAFETGLTDVRLGGSTEQAAGSSGQTSFAAGEAVHLTRQLQDVPTKTPVTVVWYGPKGERVREETNWTRGGERALSFTASDTGSWKSGDYRAELWIANRKIKQEPFEIKEIRHAP